MPWDSPLYAASGGDLRRFIRNRSPLILKTVASVTCVAIVALLFIPTRYRSEVRLLTEGNRAAWMQVNGNSPLSALFGAPAAHDVATQVEEITNPDLQNEALSKLHLSRRDVQYQIAQVKNTDVVSIKASALKPDYARSAAQTLANLYLLRSTSYRRSELLKARDFAAHQQYDALQKLLRTEKAAAHFKRKHQIADLNAEEEQREIELGQLSTRRDELTHEVAGLHAHLRSCLQQLDRMPQTIQSTVKRSNPKIDELQEKLAQLETDRRALLLLYKPNHIKIQTIDAEITALRARLKHEPELVAITTRSSNPERIALAREIQDIKAKSAASNASLDQLVAGIAQLREKIGRLADWQSELERIERDKITTTATFNNLSQEVTNLDISAKAQPAAARIIQPATIPTAPFWPNRLQVIATAIGLGLFLGICLGLLMDYQADRNGVVIETAVVSQRAGEKTVAVDDSPHSERKP